MKPRTASNSTTDPTISKIVMPVSGLIAVPTDARDGPGALKNDKFREYTRYAEYCLNMVASTRDQELRCAQREMAAEWLRLADTIRRPRKFKQMQMG